MASDRENIGAGAAIAAAILIAAIVAYSVGGPGNWSESGFGAAPTNANAQGAPSTPSAGAPGYPLAANSVNLSDSQLASVKVEPVGEREFLIEKEAVGSIDFNQDMTVQVFTPYQGRIIGLFAKVGDDVKKGQTLFTSTAPTSCRPSRL
jgi:cobalt-zinc-cadmium efflux system membrane fusion protein